MSDVLARVLARPEPTTRQSLFDRLPAVYRDPASFRPVRVTDDPLAGATRWVSADSMVTSGAEGDRVARLQLALARARHDPGPSDGSFGPRTQDAVRAFQRQRGLVVDGMVGPQTMDELTAPLLRRFLDGLAEVMAPVVSALDNLAAYASVGTAPEGFVEWLGWLVGAEPMEEWDAERRRRAVATALELHRGRGTLPGVAALVALHLGIPADEVVVTDGGETSWDVDPDAELATAPDTTVLVALPSGSADLDPASRERLRHALVASLPVGFQAELTVRGDGDGGR